VLAIVREAGWPIWLLIATSVLAMTLIIERLLILRRSRILPPGLLEDVLVLLQRPRTSPDVVTKLDRNSPLGRVLATGLRNRHRARAAMKEAIEETGQSVAHHLGRNVGTIGTIAAVAPLMGLFGNTGFGIFIAIPAMIFYRYFRARIDDFLHDLEQAASRLVDAVHVD